MGMMDKIAAGRIAEATEMKVAQAAAQQVTTQDSVKEANAEAEPPNSAAYANKRAAHEEPSKRIQKSVVGGIAANVRKEEEDIGDQASKFSQDRNPEELNPEHLARLRGRIKGASAEEIIKLVNEFYPNEPYLADEALDFLLLTAPKEKEPTLHEAVSQAKAQFNTDHGREITTGRAIKTQAQEAAVSLGQTPGELRKQYTEVTSTERDTHAIYNDLTKNKKYSYKDLKKVVDFMLHALGAEMKPGASNPADNVKLQHLCKEAKALQAVVQDFRFFGGRMRLVRKMFEKAGVVLPATVSVEMLVSAFMELTADRYPNSAKVLQILDKFGLNNITTAGA